jgi:predicted nucleotidyltransferase
MKDLWPTPYGDLNAVLAALVEAVRPILVDNLVGVYLQGSFAVGDFDEHSDVDFVVATREELDDHALPRLRKVHPKLYALDSDWAKHLEGSYFPVERLRRHDLAGGQLWYVDNGSTELILSDHDDTIVVRWTVREYGIALYGPDPKSLIDPIPADALKREVRATMHDWARQLADGSERMSTRWYQAFAVLSYARMLHTLETGRVGSKLAGAEWAKRTLDPKWAGLIDRAWADRPDPTAKCKLPADPADRKATFEFLDYALDYLRKA